MKILIVATYFPPYASVAVVRVSSLARYLLDKGYTVSVLTKKMPERKNTPLPSGLDKIESITEVSVNENDKFFGRSNSYAEAFRSCMKSQKPDCVFITCGTYETVPLCTICKDEFNTRVVLDYRDLWIFDMRSKKEFFRPSELIKKIMFYSTERKALASADAVVTVTDGWADILRRAY
ncbi:MAG: glycosyltransferase, partial [Ruminococcus sp.]|nr:glycosyltransferase [Ruminococcus sp.]